MSNYLYPQGIATWSDPAWTGVTTRVWALLGPAGIFNPAHLTLADLAATEVSGGGYARVDVSGAVTFYDTPSQQSTYFGAMPPTFTGIAAGTQVAALALADNASGVDSSSPLIAYWELDSPVTTDGTDLVFELPLLEPFVASPVDPNARLVHWLAVQR